MFVVWGCCVLSNTRVVFVVAFISSFEVIVVDSDFSTSLRSQ